MSMFSIFHSFQPQADDFECALSSHWLWRSQHLPELWTQDECQVQMEVAVESRPRFPQQGLLRNKAGRVGISNSHRCREVQGRRWGPQEGPFPPSYKSVLMRVCLKGDHCCLNPLAEPVSSRRPHHWKWAERPTVSSMMDQILPPLAQPRQQGDRTLTTLSGAWSKK